MSLEANKIAAAVLTAGIVAMSSGFIADMLFSKEETLAEGERAYTIASVEAMRRTGPDVPPVVELQSILPLLASADALRGETLIRACVACHTFEKGGPSRVGPNLWDIMGAKPAHEEGFAYSAVIQNLDIAAWDYDSMNAFLADPRGYAPGTKMSYGGLRRLEDRADLIAWMRTQSDDPVPLPTAEEIEAALGQEDRSEDANNEEAPEGADDEGTPEE